MDLNNPDIRQALLRDRLGEGLVLVATDLADEFGVSADTIRRDLIGLERAGVAARVRGGAVPVSPPARPLRERRQDGAIPSELARRAAEQLQGASTLLLDGGTTVLAVAARLRPRAGLLVITPSPFVAALTHGNGIETVVLGGPLSERGGIAVGPRAEAEVADVAADIALVGVCGLEADFGLGSDDLLESTLVRAMSRAATRTIAVTGHEKIGRRARYRTLPPEEIDMIVTDAAQPDTAPFRAKEIEVINV
ncbi:DeoR/GlpR family DNA-binding transcription regulator [Pelagovum pacificum]|uniref:DeoR/GlpR transcriptional regulator n=1 Tax=Pelagovum pacificum TaxID=2588711 RepID=A0A5C5GBW5_9RHOB|nr:DeoR/GlpR family DNA-binding transcription regulator [Pelagovum pacificum]QQA42392.1 DeoR/GlpR transcriptional regulator [Pelagovum pacificum]TNY31474.1 DeoR/GlpR transcriptional regulator [Pelagovum pacificum]